jgi:DNA/RNA endonuclease YhcR with UshA esterase domain
VRTIATFNIFVATVALVLCATAARAHHSFAMFDMSKTITFKGTVKELQWTNPHVWLELTVQEKDGSVTYSFEGAAIAVLKRVGWTKDSVKAGEVVTVVGHPYKNGKPGGSIDHLILANGSKLGTGDAIPGALRVPGVQ